MAHIEMNELNNEVTLSEDELAHVRGGLLPAVRTTTDSTVEYECSNNLKQIGIAIHN